MERVSGRFHLVCRGKTFTWKIRNLFLSSKQMETLATPKIEMLLFRLSVLSSDLSTQLEKVRRHIHKPDDQTIILLPSRHNIVDRKKDKERHLKRWRVEIKEIIDSVIDADPL